MSDTANKWLHETSIYHSSVADFYCTAPIYYSSAQRTAGTAIMALLTVQESSVHISKRHKYME